LRSHNLRLYFELCWRLNWFKIKLINLANPIYA
jgi:hypothetical protein